MLPLSNCARICRTLSIQAEREVAHINDQAKLQQLDAKLLLARNQVRSCSSVAVTSVRIARQRRFTRECWQ
jgi:hypothetical protein